MKTTGAGSKKRSLAEFRAMHKTAGPDSPIYKSGLTMTSVRAATPSTDNTPSSPSTTTGQQAQTGKRTGLLYVREGELHSRTDSPTTMSFGYFRTKSGLPPDVEKARASKDETPGGKKHD